MSHVKFVKKPLLRFLRLETSMKRLSYGSFLATFEASCKNWCGIGSGILIMIMNSKNDREMGLLSIWSKVGKHLHNVEKHRVWTILWFPLGQFSMQMGFENSW